MAQVVVANRLLAEVHFLVELLELNVRCWASCFHEPSHREIHGLILVATVLVTAVLEESLMESVMAAPQLGGI